MICKTKRTNSIQYNLSLAGCKIQILTREAKSADDDVWMGGGTNDGGPKAGMKSGTGIRNMMRLPRADAPGYDRR